MAQRNADRISTFATGGGFEGFALQMNHAHDVGYQPISWEEIGLDEGDLKKIEEWARERARLYTPPAGGWEGWLRRVWHFLAEVPSWLSVNGSPLEPRDLLYERWGWPCEWEWEEEPLLPHYDELAADARIRGDSRWTRYERNLRAKTLESERKGFGKVGFRGGTGRSGEKGSPGRNGRTWRRDRDIRRDRALPTKLLEAWEQAAETAAGHDDDFTPQEVEFMLAAFKKP